MQVFDEEGRLKVNFGATAADVNIVDGGGHFVATEVESALQELGHLTALTVAEVDQLENIGATTISAIQWGALGALVEWTDWVPTLTGGADLSGYTHARYYRIGDICFFEFSAANKNVTTAGNIRISLPFQHANTGAVVCAIMVYDGAGWAGFVYNEIPANASYIVFSKDAAAGAWAGTENGVYITITGLYEII